MHFRNARGVGTAMLAAVLIPALMNAQPASLSAGYPEARRGDQRDLYHGLAIADPYRWMEQSNSPELLEWIGAQNSVTQRYLSSLPGRDFILQKLTSLWDNPNAGVPVRARNRYFYASNSGLQNHPVLNVQDGLSGKPRVLLDPNVLSPDGSISVTVSSPSPDGNLLAYSVSTDGSEWQEFRVRDVKSARDLADTLKWARLSGAAWTRDSKGFFYTRYDAPAPGEEHTAVLRDQKLYFHRVGTPQSEDVLILIRRDEPDLLYDVQVGTDGEYAVITARRGSDTRNLVFFIDLNLAGARRVTSPVVRLIDDFIGSFRFIHSVYSPTSTRFYFLTDLDAPKGRIVAIDIDNPGMEHWSTVVPEGPDAIQDVRFIYDRFVAHALHNAYSQLRFYTLRGTPTGGVHVPGMGTVTHITGSAEHEDMFFNFASYLSPTIVYRYDFEKSKLDTAFLAKVDFPLDQYETSQIFGTSKDGTRIPIFVTARKGLPLDGSHPTILSGSGASNAALTPEFSPTTLAWLSMGGVYAVANLRGSGGFGRNWYLAGARLRKQTAIDDFIGAAEHLIDLGYTSRSKLAIQGSSNGGLIVGAVMTQRPDLAAVVLPSAGVMDMLRFTNFTAGIGWTHDFGSPADPEQFGALLSYSPLHNVREGSSYPATLVMAADHDDRVVPIHSFKFAAALQAAQAGDSPVLLRIEANAGHSAGRPILKRIHEAADGLAFAWVNMGMRIIQ